MRICEHIIYVADMAAQVAYYRDKLGLAISYPMGRPDYSGEYWVTFATGECTLALHGGGERRIGEDAPQVVFLVDDLAAKRAELCERGVELGEIHEAAPGILVCNGRDPENNRFSLESRDPAMVH